MPIFTKNSKLNMLRTIIIDDEAHQRLTIRKMVDNYCPGLSIIAEAESVKTGVQAIRRHKPDLILLDIKMSDGNGFDLLQKLQPIDFKVIFITAYDHYAIKAFRFSALDYLLKPIDPDELVQAVAKAGESLQKDFNLQLENLKDHIATIDSINKKIVVKTHDSIHLVPVNDIVYCESECNYVYIYLDDGSRIVVSSTLKDYDDILVESGFMRVHKSYLINVRKITRFEKSEGGMLVLGNKYRIPVASRKREELMEMFNHLAHD